jgi:pimeloyl-ACP methyl ester carboxylesterase
MPKSPRLSYQINGQGQPLVLIHGLAGSSRWWSKIMPDLSAAFRVYSIDLPGFGESAPGTFSLADASQQVLTLLDRLNIDHFNLLGHSMGGYVSADIAARHPERVGRMVLTNAAVVPVRNPILPTGKRLARSVRYLPLDFLPLLCLNVFQAGPLTIFSAIRQILRADFSPHLAELTCDLLIVWGENDIVLPLEMGYQIHARLPRAAFEVIPRCGHLPFWEQPRAFIQAVVPFLKAENGGSNPAE